MEGGCPEKARFIQDEPGTSLGSPPYSYGFRPGRGCHDAIESLHNTLCGKSRRVWILDADLAGAFDKISHGHLLGMLGGFPARDMIAGWLKAGIFEAGKGFAPTWEGTPQGGGATRGRTCMSGSCQGGSRC